MTDNLSGGFLAAPKPRSYGDVAGDYLHQARTWLDGVTPGLGSIAPFLGGAGGAAITGATQGDILGPNHPATAAIRQKVQDAQTKYALGSDPSAMLGPSTLPYTAAPVPQAMSPAAPAAPALAAPTAAAPPPPAPVKAPTSPQVSDGGYNALDAQAANVSDGGYNALDAQANEKPYGLGNRLANAGASLSNGGLSFFDRNTAMMKDQNGDFLDPQAGRQAEATGPDLIQKYLNRLHGKA